MAHLSTFTTFINFMHLSPLSLKPSVKPLGDSTSQDRNNRLPTVKRVLNRGAGPSTLAQTQCNPVGKRHSCPNPGITVLNMGCKSGTTALTTFINFMSGEAKTRLKPGYKPAEERGCEQEPTVKRVREERQRGPPQGITRSLTPQGGGRLSFLHDSLLSHGRREAVFPA